MGHAFELRSMPDTLRYMLLIASFAFSIRLLVKLRLASNS